ncbi:MAG TPA: LptA/OstA family protein [Candidatus Binataceae bacterium]
MIVGTALVLALCAGAPLGALAQSASPAPDAAAAAAAATASPGAVLPGASIRKTQAAATGGGSASADGAPSAAPASAPPAAGGINADGDVAAPAGAGVAGGAAAASAPAGVVSSGETAAPTPAPAMPGTAESVSAPAALATPGAEMKARAKAKAAGKGQTPRHANSKGAQQSAPLQTASKDTKADSKDAKATSQGDSQNGPFSSLQFSGNKGPIDIKSDALDLDYKGNIVTFRGHVHATQADATLTSDTLTVFYGKDFHEVKEMVANNNVRMSQGTRWATGDHAVLDQAKHTVTLTGSPVVHDGEDQVTGSKITVHLDTGKSEVEGARAVFFPKDQKTRDNKTTVAKSP